jgi:tRNA-2-methylthio-N6-dimethylallyladenosine synthase
MTSNKNNKKGQRTLFYFIKTFGCQMNVNDSEFLAGQLEEIDYVMTQDIKQADLIILNTCCVRKKVEQKIYSLVGIIKQMKTEKPELILGICGCLAQK